MLIQLIQKSTPSSVLLLTEFQMFAILPTNEDFCKDDAEWFTDLDAAYDSAFDWSVELSGSRVNVYEVRHGKFNKLTEVFA